MGFFDQWLWAFSIVAGLVMAIAELLLAIDTGLDLVFIGSGLVLSGLVTWPFHSWVITVIVAAVVCAGYVALGRRYVHRRMAVKAERTNVDAIVGRHGVALTTFGRNTVGRVRVNNEQWRAVSNEQIEEGGEVEVVEVKGVTLTVKRSTGGS